MIARRIASVIVAGNILVTSEIGSISVSAKSLEVRRNNAAHAVTEVAQVGATAPPADFGSPPTGEIPILFNDRHVYAQPDQLQQGRVLAALIRGGTILAPLRSMLEQMGATVSYDSATKTVDVAKPGSDVKVTVGKSEVTINGESRPLDVPPMIYQGVIVMPVRVISEGMGAYVQWVPEKHLVVIRYIPSAPPSPPPTPAPTFPPPPPPPPPTPGPVHGSIVETFDVPDGRPIPATPQFGRYSYVLLPNDEVISRRFVTTLINEVQPVNAGEPVQPGPLSSATRAELGDARKYNAFYLPVKTLTALNISTSKSDLDALLHAYDYTTANTTFQSVCDVGSNRTLQICKDNGSGLRRPVVLMAFVPLPRRLDSTQASHSFFLFDFGEPTAQFAHTIDVMRDAISAPGGPGQLETEPGREAAVAGFMIGLGRALCQGASAVYYVQSALQGKKPETICESGSTGSTGVRTFADS